MSHIFISYARKDKEYVRKIVTSLELNGFNIWIDLDDLPKGVDWEQEIYHNIDEAEAFLFMLSAESVTSDMCNKEIAHAVATGKRIIPIFISSIEDGEIHLVLRNFIYDEQRKEISRRNFIFCREGQENFEKAIKEICETVHTDYEWLKYHTRLQVKAQEWERTKDASRLLRGKELHEAEEVFREANNRVRGGKLQAQQKEIFNDASLTSLQKAYVEKSRLETLNSQIKIILATLSVLVVFFIVVTWFSSQVGFARIGENSAVATTTAALNREVAQLDTAQAEATRAENQANAYATAQELADANAATAIAESTHVAEQRSAHATAQVQADEQKNIAVARELAQEAKLILDSPVHDIHLSTLLTIESIKRYPNLNGLEILKENLDLLPSRLISFSLKGQVRAVDFNPKFKWVASGDFDGNVIVWDVANGKELATFNHNGAILALEFSPDGRKVVTGSKDGTARVWNAQTGQEISRMDHGSAVMAVRFSPDGQRVVSGDADGISQVWNASTGIRSALVHGSNDNINRGITSVDFSPDGKYFVAAGPGAAVWEAATGLMVSEFKTDEYVFVARFSPDGSKVIIGDDLAYAIVWEAASGKEITRIRHPGTKSGGVIAVEFNPAGTYAISAAGTAKDHTLIVWDIETGEEVFNTVYLSDERIYNMSVSQDGTKAVVASDGYVKVWSLFNGKEIANLPVNANVFDVDIDPDGKILVYGDGNGTVGIWSFDANTGDGFETYQFTYGDYIYDVAASPGRQWIAFNSCVEYDGSPIIDCIKYETIIREINTDKVIFSLDNGRNTVLFSPDGKQLVLKDSGLIQVLDISSKTNVAQFESNSEILDLCFSPDSSKLAATEENGGIEIFDLVTMQKISQIWHGDGVLDIEFSPDSKLLISGGDDEMIRLWDVNSGTEFSEMYQGGSIGSLAFSHDGKRILSASSNGDVTVWDTLLMDQIMKISYGSGDQLFYGAFFLGDTYNFVTYGEDNHIFTTKVWDGEGGFEQTRLSYDALSSNRSIQSPDGKWIISSGCDHYGWGNCDSSSIRIWSPVDGEEITKIDFGELEPDIDITSDGKWIIARQINTVRLFLWNPEDLTAEACEKLSRNLSRAEWQQFFGDEPYRATCSNLPVPQE